MLNCIRYLRQGGSVFIGVYLVSLYVSLFVKRVTQKLLNLRHMEYERNHWIKVVIRIALPYG